MECPRFIRFCVTNFEHMRRFVSYAHVTSGLVASLSDIIFSQFFVAVQGFIKEAEVGGLRMWDLFVSFVINHFYS